MSETAEPFELVGAVAFVDDELADANSVASELRAVIQDHGHPVMPYERPPDPSAVKHWRALAFLVLDWDFLHPAGLPGVVVGDEARESSTAKVVTFLRAFLAAVFSPVFIISAESTTKIEDALKAAGVLDESRPDSRIKVLAKNTVKDDLFVHLNEWLEKNLTMSVLKVWENEYEKAKNRLFSDFNELAQGWPRAFWDSAIQDSIDPSFELASAISSNLLHRIDLVKFDEAKLKAAEHSLKSEEVRRVAYGRTVMPNSRLHSSIVMPGDFFGLGGDGESSNEVWLNLTPACHTVGGRKPHTPVKLYLVRGQREPIPESNNKFKELQKKESPNASLVHALLDGHPFVFDFKNAQIRNWSGIKSKRIGRMLPPYITRIQQANSLFMQVEGVPHVDWEFYKPTT